ncbi:MAG: 50S ribosomal protein L15 [Phycisphaerales bacterium]|nr:50S ribosomal protein L15 [Phycisphaerales bacterium]
MMIHDITAKAGRYKKRLRVGRGEGGGRGKQSGRGNKGAGSRSGTTRRAAFEGGQMPLFRRIRKYGFTNAAFRTDFWIVNLGDIMAHPMFAKGGDINSARLVQAGLIRDDSRPLKVLGDLGETKGLSAKLAITAARVSDSVRKAVTGAGGTVTETGTRKDHTRGIDRNSDDRAPKKLTKKLKRGSKARAAAAAEGKGDAKPEGKSEGKPEGKAKPEVKARPEKPVKGEGASA